MLYTQKPRTMRHFFLAFSFICGFFGAYDGAFAQSTVLTATANVTALCPGNATTVNLVANATPGGGTYSWQPANLLNSATVANPTAIIAQPTVFVVAYTLGGVTVRDTVTVAATATLHLTASNDTLCNNQTTTNLNAIYSGNNGSGIQTFANTVAVPIIDLDTVYSAIMVTGMNTTIAPNVISKVCIDLAHTYDADLDIYLIAPNGSRMELTTDNGGGSDNYTNTCFLPMATNPITVGTAPFTGDYAAEGNWSDLNGNANGTWTLQVIDDEGGDNGSLANWTLYLGTATAYTYAWTPTATLSDATINNPIASPTVSTMYRVTVSDGVCPQTDSIYIVKNPACLSNCLLSVVVTPPSHVLTCQNPTIAITTAVTGQVGAVVYSWSTGAATPAITANTTGNYTVTATDASGCTALAQASVLSNISAPSIAISPLNPLLNCQNPTAALTASSNVGTATYAWVSNVAPPATGAAILATQAGIYTVTVRNLNNNCTNVATVTVVATDPMLLQTTSDTIYCAQQNGSVTVTPLTGVAPYTYHWSNGATVATIGNLPQGLYTATVTDAGGCSRTATARVTTKVTTLALTLTTQPLTCGLNNGLIAVAVSNGTPNYNYLWSTGASFLVIDNLAQATYSVTATDANGCTGSASVALTAQAGLLLDSRIVHHADCTNTFGNVVANASGGTLPYTYIWSNGATTHQIANLPADTYTVTATDAAGCSATASLTVVLQTTMTVTIDSLQQPFCGLANGYIKLGGYDGQGPFSFAWLPNVTASQMATNLLPDIYGVTITSANGCATSTIVSLTNVPTTLATSIAISYTTCTVANATATTTGNTALVNYAWNTGATTATLNNLPQGTYTVTAAQANGCTATASFAQSGSNPILPYAAIKDNQLNSPTLDTLTVSGYAAASATINTANPLRAVFANLEHTYAGDVKITLRCPTGQTVVLKDNGGAGSFLGVANDGTNGPPGIGSTFVWTMTAPNTLNNTTPVINNTNPFAGSNNHASLLDGEYLPDGAFANMNGCPINGKWVLSISDNADQDDGNLFAWGLQLPSACTATHTFAKAVVSNGNGSRHYAWSDLTQNPTLTDLGTNKYTVTITDACNVLFDTLSIPHATYGIDVSPATCQAADGSATFTGAPANATFAWSNGATTAATATNLPTGWYSVTATSAACTLHRNFYIPQSGACIATIAGYALTDIGASNCTVQTTDLPVANAQITLRNIANNQTQHTFTDATGAYRFATSTLGNYEITYAPDTACTAQTLTCPALGSLPIAVTATNTRYADNNFYLATPTLQGSLSANISYDDAVPNTATIYTIRYQYNGAQPLANATLTLQHPFGLTNFTNLTTTPVIYNATNQTATFALGTLAPNAAGQVRVSFNVPTSIPVGQSIFGIIAATPNSPTDCSSHRYNFVQQVAATPYQTDKQIIVAQPLTRLTTLTNFPLRYQIRFVNNTPDTAYTVTILDTLAIGSYDFSQIHLIASSHACTMTLRAPNILVFTLANINLPNTATNAARAHGFVQFELPIATNAPITNTAAVFFDYSNTAHTNATVSTDYTPTTHALPPAAALTAALMPNPATTATTLQYTTHTTQATEIRLTNLLGSVLQSWLSPNDGPATTHRLTIPTHALAAGVYLVALRNAEQQLTLRLVVQ